MPIFTIFMAVRRALLPAFLPVLFSLVLAGCGSQVQNAIKVQDLLSEAGRHAQVDPDDKQARAWVDRAIAVAPRDIDTYVGARDPGPTGPLFSIAEVFAAVGDDAATALYMQQAIQKFPGDERPYQILADAQGRLGQTAARKATAAALAGVLTQEIAKPGAQDIESLTLERAQALCDAGDLTGGAAEYQKAMRAYPTISIYPNGLAYAYAEANTHLPEALALAQKALTLAQRSTSDGKDLDVAAIQDTLGWVQYRLGDLKDAEQNLEEAAAVAPRLPEVRYHLGTVYAAEGKTDAAHAEFGHAVLLAKDYAAAKQALAALPKSTVSASS